MAGIAGMVLMGAGNGAGADENLIGRWTFDAATNLGRNAVSKDYAAKVEKGARVVEGVFGKAIEMRATDSTGAIIRIPEEVIPAGFKEFTFSVWILPQPNAEYATLIRKEDAGVHSENRLLFALQKHGRYLTLGINCGGNYAECDAIISPEEIYDGAWHLATATFDGQWMRVFLDGREAGSFRRQAPLNTIHDFTPLSSWRDDIAHARYSTLAEGTVRSAPVYAGSTGGRGEFFKGSMDDLRIYARAISFPEIEAMYEEGVGKIAEGMLKASEASQKSSEALRQSSASSQKARRTAAELYLKAGTFTKTLDKTDENINLTALYSIFSPQTDMELKQLLKEDHLAEIELHRQKILDPLTVVELQRLLRHDFPEETNAYVMKWDKSPTDNLLLDEHALIDGVNRLAIAAFEYLPLTEMQWNVVPARERAKWERVKEIRAKFGSTIFLDNSDSVKLKYMDRRGIVCSFGLNSIKRLNSLIAAKPSLAATKPLVAFSLHPGKDGARPVSTSEQTQSHAQLLRTDGAPTVSTDEQTESAASLSLVSILYELENLVEDRPRSSEAVAPYVFPHTPATVNRTTDEARKLIEEEWLYQCDNRPTISRILQEIKWTRKLIARLNLNEDDITQNNAAIITSNVGQAQGQPLPSTYTGYITQNNATHGPSPAVITQNKTAIPQTPFIIRPDYSLLTTRYSLLDELEALAYKNHPDSTDVALYFAVRTVKREIMFSNPVIDFTDLVYIDNPYPQGAEADHETRHRLGYQAVPGGRLMIQHGLQPDAPLTQLMPTYPLHGTFWRPDVSYDGQRVLFSFKPHNEKTFHIYEIGADGSGLRQLTGGIFDDLDPIYLPDDKNIMFLTTRGHIYVRCMPPTNAFVMARMPVDTKPGDRNLYIISRSGEPEYTPSVMHDGRVIYTRWEYTDKPLWRAQSLWTMQQNGAMVQTFWGNQSVWPDLLKDARAIPGSDKIMFTGSAHHNWFSGTVGVISPSQGFNFPDGLTKVTADVEWPECGRAPLDPHESADYHSSGNYTAYYSPYPLGEKDFLVSAKRNKQKKFVLLLMDADGNREIITEGAYNIWDAQPLRARIAQPVRPDPVIWPTWEERDSPQPGILYSSNVYEGASDELKGKAKYLRILSIEHKTYTYWFKRNYVSSGPEISANQSEGVKKIIGTVPIEDDGSVNFTAPSGLALHFQLLDAEQRALQTMRSFTGVQPGESRGCFGCHESHTRTTPNAPMAKAIKRAPSTIIPVPWKDISVSYERYVQPALDAHCARCHQDPAQPAYKSFNATLRPGFLGFKEPYMTLLGSPTWGSPYKERENAGGGFGWADVIMVEAYGTLDSAAYISPQPMTRLSYRSRLVERMSSGKHHGVRVDPENLLRVILWVDAMGPYYGTEELRRMEDPVFQGKGWLSQPPRVQSAPIVQRPGPFDPFDTDEAYDTPTENKYNQLPICVIK